jgi:phospholipid/cholesterol/gamma-HCH transport system permease protein
MSLFLELYRDSAVFVLSSAFFKLLGKRCLKAVETIGGISSLTLRAFRVIFRGKIEFEELIRQFSFIGNRSFSIVALIALFTGLVMGLQLAVGLGRFGLKIYIGQMVSLSVFRELAPVLTALMIAARVGSGIAAELGSMVVTEQVLAIEAMGADPVQKLVVPRMLATMIAAPILTIMADVIGTFGGLIIAVREAGVTSRFYMDQVRATLETGDFTSGITKAVFFGFFISMICCHRGLKAFGGTEGVGRSTTEAVVISSLTVGISDFFLTKLILSI